MTPATLLREPVSQKATTVRFTCYGCPVPQGSSRAFIPKGWTRPVITSANKNLKSWRQEVAGAAMVAMQGLEKFERKVAVRVEASFYFAKPKSAKKSTVHKVTKPDADKLLRALLDSLTGIVIEDDAQVTECGVCKFFGTPERVEVTVTEV